MTTPKLVFHPNRLSISAIEAQNCLREIRLLLPSDSYRFDPRTGTLSVYGPGPMTRAAKIVRGFYPKATTTYAPGYSDWLSGLKAAKPEYDRAAAAAEAATRVKTAEDARRKAEAAAQEAKQRAERLQEELRRTKEARTNESRNWGRSDSGDPSDPYNVLGVRRDAPKEVILAAYRALSKLWHPDRGGDPEQMKRLNAAMDRLGIKP
jgi:hypothetical protein